MKATTLALWAVASSGAAATCPATSLLDTIIARGQLRVGMTGSYKPFSYLTASNSSNSSNSSAREYIGADVDMARSLSAALGLASDPEFISATFANLTNEVAAGAYDIAMTGVSITMARARYAFLSAPLLRVGKVATVRCGDAAKYQTLAAIDVAGVKVATPAGGSNEAFDRANLESATIVVYPQDDNNVIFQAVADGAADVMITDRVEAELQARLHPGVLCAVRPEEPFSFEELGYLVRRDGAWLEFVNQWLNVQVGSGAWNRTLEGWMAYAWPQT